MPRVEDDGFSDTSSQHSRSSAGLSVSSFVSGNAGNINQWARFTRARPRGQQAQGTASMGDLFSRLEAAERQLKAQPQDSASSRSSHSEERDNGLLGEQLLDEIERRSTKSEETHHSGGARSGGARSGGAHSGPKEREPEQAVPVKASKSKGSHGGGNSSSGGTSKNSSGQHSSSLRRDAGRRDSKMKRPEIERLDPLEAKDELALVVDIKDEALAKVENLKHRMAEEEAIAREKGEEVVALAQAATVAQEAKRADRLDLLTDVKALEVKKDVLVDKLTNVKAEKDAIKEDRDALADALEGLKARHQVELQKVKAKHYAEMRANWQEVEEAKQAEATEAHANANMLAAKLNQSEREKNQALKEADILRIKEAMARAETTAKGAKVTAMRAELAEGPEEAAKNVASRLMESAAEVEQKMQEAMGELKKKMKALDNKTPGYATQMETLQQQWDTANQSMQKLRAEGGGGGSAVVGGSSSSSSSSSSSPSRLAEKTPNQPQPQPTLNMPTFKSQKSMGYSSVMGRTPLATITEGEDLMSGDGSVAGARADSMVACSLVAPSGCQFSSNGDESVGDLHDFDDAVEDPLALIKNGKVSVKSVLQDIAPATRDGQRIKVIAEKAAEKVIKEKDEIAEELAKKKREKEHLREEVEAKEMREHMLQEEIAEKLAADESKIARLQWQLAKRREEQEEKDEFILELKQRVEVKDVRLENFSERLEDVWAKAEFREENLRHIRQELEAKKGQKEDLNRWVQDLQDQLESAWEKQRVAEARADDLRMALEAQEYRYIKVIEDLRQEIRLLKRDGGSGGHESAPVSPGGGGEDDSGALKEELTSARKEIKKLEEERNILQNVLEWKEVQFRNTVEDLEQQLANQAATIKQELQQGQDNLLYKLDKQAEALRQRFGQDSTPASNSTREPTPCFAKTGEGQAFPPVDDPCAEGMKTRSVEALAENREDHNKTTSECSSHPNASDVSG